MVTVNKTDLSNQTGLAPLALLREIDRGLGQVLDLWCGRYVISSAAERGSFSSVNDPNTKIRAFIDG